MWAHRTYARLRTTLNFTMALNCWPKLTQGAVVLMLAKSPLRLETDSPPRRIRSMNWAQQKGRAAREIRCNYEKPAVTCQ